MEETRKRHSGGESETPTVVPTKKPRALAISDAAGDLVEDRVAWLAMEDDTVGELMKFVEADSEAATAARVRFTDNPYSSVSKFQGYSSYVTINGNEESCGSSFSDSESSVMASVDMGVTGWWANNGVGDFHWEKAGGAWISKEDVAACGLLVEEDAVVEFLSEGLSVDGDHGLVGWDWDEDCVARFLGEDFFNR